MSSTFKIIDGDVVVNSATGRPILLSTRDALRQIIGESLSINTLENGFGAGISGTIGTTPVDTTTFTLLISRRIRSSVEALMTLQSESNVQRSADEIVTGVSFIKVVQDTSDQRVFLYYVDVTTLAGPTIRASGKIVR